MALFNILVDIAARTANMEAGIERAEKKLEGFAEAAKKVGETALEFAGISLAFEGIKQSIEGAISRGAEFERLSARMEASVEDLSRLEFAAKSTAVPFEALTASFETFTKNVGMASDGTGRARKALAALHIDAAKLVALPLKDQLEAIAGKLSAIENPAKRAQYEMQLFGDAGAKLDPFFRKGAAGLDELMAEADKLGITLTHEVTEKLAEAHEAMIKMEASSTALKTELAVGLAPAIETLSGWLVTATNGIRGFGAAVAKSIYGEADPTLKLTEQLDGLVTKRNNVLESIRQLQSENVAETTHAYDPAIERAKAQLITIEAEMNRINGYIQQNMKDADAATAAAKKPSQPDIGRGPSLDPVKINKLNKESLDKMTEFYDTLDKMTRTSVEKDLDTYEDKKISLKELYDSGLIDAKEFAKRSREILDDALPELKPTALKMEKQVKETTDQIQAFANQAARNIQTSFANFLFDPFKDGTKGMLTNFINVVRRMIAEALSAQILKKLFGGSGVDTKDGGSGLGSLLGKGLSSLAGSYFAGGMAEGGSLSAGQTALVGEAGPELLTMGSNGGVITPNHQLGGTTTLNHSPTYNIDARGADAERIMSVMPGLLAQAAQKTKQDLLAAFRNNGLAAPRYA